MLILCGRNKDGFTLIEVIVGVAVIAITITAVTLLTNKVIRTKKTSDSLVRIKRIEDALELSYREAIAYVEKNCAGWGETGCADGSLNLRSVVGTESQVVAYLPTQAAQKAWGIAGCSLTATALQDNYTIQCPGEYKGDILFSNIQNEHSPGSVYLNGYNRTPFSVKIYTTIPGTNVEIGDTWSAGYLDAEYYEKNSDKIFALARALKSYHFNRLLYEANNNNCTPGSGGLSSNDDALIPWVWQIISASPHQACSGIETGACGCSDFTTSEWPQSSAWLEIDTESELNTLIDNLGFPNRYLTDGYGNKLTVRLLTDKDGNAVSLVPSKPKVDYYDCLPGGSGGGCSNGTFTQLPPYVGFVGVLSGSNEIYFQKMVYSN